MKPPVADGNACPIPTTQLEDAVTALQKAEELKKSEEKTILDDNKSIYMIITLHKIPAIKKKRRFLQLPVPLFSKISDICLITKDIDKKETDKSIDHYEDLMRKCGIEEIKEVLPLTRLKLDYKSYEAKRRLCGLHDLFLCESSILHRMPSLTGKYFLQHRKTPRGFEIPKNEKAFKNKLTKELKLTEWFMSGDGNCSSVCFAKTDFPIGDIVKNLSAIINGVAKFAPRGWENVRSLFIKTQNSSSVPIYVNDECAETCDLFDEQEVEFMRRKRQRIEAPKELLQQAGVHIKQKKKRRPIEEDVL